jgi:hypothetical protein
VGPLKGLVLIQATVPGSYGARWMWRPFVREHIAADLRIVNLPT